MQRLFPLRAIPYTWNKAAAGFPPWSQAGDNDTHLLKKKQDEIQVVISKTFRTSVNGIGTAKMELPDHQTRKLYASV